MRSDPGGLDRGAGVFRDESKEWEIGLDEFGLLLQETIEPHDPNEARPTEQDEMHERTVDRLQIVAYLPGLRALRQAFHDPAVVERSFLDLGQVTARARQREDPTGPR
jgi:hypothetical protein